MIASGYGLFERYACGAKRFYRRSWCSQKLVLGGGHLRRTKRRPKGLRSEKAGAGS
jgi:hypothetical protein